MIEKLYPEKAAPDPRYRQTMEDILQSEEKLAYCLSEEGKRHLAALTNAYARREEAAVQSAFHSGFRTAAELAVDVLRDQRAQ